MNIVQKKLLKMNIVQGNNWCAGETVKINIVQGNNWDAGETVKNEYSAG